MALEKGVGIVTGGGDCPGLNAVIRAVILGHLRRGGSPTHMDRALCTLFGTKAVELIAGSQFGQMVAHTGTQIAGVPLLKAIGQLRTVPLDGGFIQ